jgi:hypothetical protein
MQQNKFRLIKLFKETCIQNTNIVNLWKPNNIYKFNQNKKSFNQYCEIVYIISLIKRIVFVCTLCAVTMTFGLMIVRKIWTFLNNKKFQSILCDLVLIALLKYVSLRGAPVCQNTITVKSSISDNIRYLKYNQMNMPCILSFNFFR